MRAHVVRHSTLVIRYCMMLGVISDTHGLLRPEALDYLADCDLIIHAGDVDRQEILDRLSQIAPVKVVRGNVDRGPFGLGLPLSEVVEYAGHLIYVIHDIGMLQIDPKAAGMRMVIYGHSHQPQIEHRDGVIFFNPGSAGRRRFSLPITAGKIRLINGDLVPEFTEIVNRE